MSFDAFPLITIDKGIPIPRRFQRHNRKYPWHEMEVGDSFLVRCATYELDKVSNSMTACRNHAQKITGKKFTIHRTTQGVRVWRTK